MESEANKEIPHTPSSDAILIEDVLRRIATFLDFRSIQQFRLVSREWNAACLPILMKRGHYVVAHSWHGNVDNADLYRAAIHYSSWKISDWVYESAELLHDKQMWLNVRSLTIQQIHGRTREFHLWAWETIENRCPYLQEITVKFRQVFGLPVDSLVESDYEEAIMGMPNESFPKTSNLTNVMSVKFSGIYDKTTAYFAQNLLQACTNLRHLHICSISQPKEDDQGVYKILEYLKQNPMLLKYLQSFEFEIAHTNEYGIAKKVEFVPFLKRNSSSVLPLQFSESLNKLFWDSPFHLDDQLLPGILTPSVASTLVELSLNEKVENLVERANEASYPIKILFPNFHRLRVLKLRFHACQSLSVPELIDSAPNLYVLEMEGMERPFKTPDISCCWRMSDGESYANPKPSKLRIFRTDIPIDGLSTLDMILSKFPNLVELRLGRVKNVGLDQFLSFIQSNDFQLQRFSWTYRETLKKTVVTLDELFQHLVRVPEQLPALLRYSLRHERTPHNNLRPISYQDMRKSNHILLNLPSNSNLVISLLLRYEYINNRCISEERTLTISGDIPRRW
jgi:hypothetical protein